MRRRRSLVPLLLSLALAGCSSSLRQPVEVPSPGGILDLRAWDFEAGPVVPLGWLWDPDVLWSPLSGGRPSGLPPALALGPPDRGGSFVPRLQPRDESGRPRRATAHLRVLVTPGKNYGLQIGAVPGADRVWVNGTLVWSSGVLSVDRRQFVPLGYGTLVTVQPDRGALDVVVEIVSSDPLIRHPELNRLWVIGPAGPMSAAERWETTWRALQACFLVLGILTFTWLSRLRPERHTLVFFVGFLSACLLKLLFTVELADPFLSAVFPSLPLSAYLFLNHGLNLLPIPFLVLFLARQFPMDIGKKALWLAVWGTAAATVWELLPFVALAAGWDPVYEGIMAAQWSFVLNVFVVLATVFIFERFYLVFQRKRPLSRSLFFGGIGMGLLVLLPIPLSYYIPVKFTYFLGWGLFLFLGLLSLDLIRLQVVTTQEEAKALADKVERLETLLRFCPPGWAGRLGKPSLDELRPGDRRPSEAVFVSLRTSAPLEAWMARAGTLASAKEALLVSVHGGAVTWALDSWSETALVFSLELQKELASSQAGVTIVLTRATVEFRVLDAGPQWLIDVAQLPADRLAELHGTAEKYGAAVVLDQSLQDGLVIGGWRRHRPLTVSGAEIELYEGEEETLAQLKDQLLELYGSALSLARAGQGDEALQSVFSVVQQNPFDQAARVHLADWGRFRPS